MKQFLLAIIIIVSGIFYTQKAAAQIDLNNLDLNKILGQVMTVQKGFSPKFFLGNTPLQKINKVAEILGLKQDPQINKLFNTFRTGRTIFQVAAYAGGAIAVYGIAKKIDKAARTQDYQGALVTGLTTVTSGVIVKLLTKGASYKAVDLFNGLAIKKIKDILSIAPASETLGAGLYVKL
jgi:hypothetical protein